MIYETERLYAREMTAGDLPELALILQDPRAMTAYEGPLDQAETRLWLDKQTERYRRDGFGLWAVILKETGRMIGQCGLSRQSFQGREVLEIGYLFQPDFWGRGYAVEAARAAKQYAFEALKTGEVFSMVREGNIKSMNVAIRNGMLIRGRQIKHYRGVDMLHYVFSVKNHG